MGAAPKKFAFETVFAADGEVLRDGQTFRASFTRAELDEAVAQALARGRADAQAAAEAAKAEALRELSTQVGAILTTLRDEADALQQEAADLALIVGRKLADAALDRFGQDQALDMIRTTLEALPRSPRLVVHLAPDTAETLNGKLDEVALEAGFVGSLLVRADSSAHVGDVRIEWAEGAIAHRRAIAVEKIDALLASQKASESEDRS